MKIQNPNVEYWLQDGEYNHISRCARVCYASETNFDNLHFVDNLWKRNHRSMFRHAGVYFIIPIEKFRSAMFHSEYCNVVYNNNNVYISTNRQYAREHLSEFRDYEIDEITAFNNEIFYNNKMLYYTFVIDTGIDITREYNRKSPNAIAERSTRYVDFIKKIGIQFKHCHWMEGMSLYKTILVKMMCKVDEWFYKISRSKYGLDLKPQDARWCLFLDTMSRAVYTYTVKDWEYIINLRLYDYTGAAHPDAKIVAQKIRDFLVEEEGYNIINFNKQHDTN